MGKSKRGLIFGTFLSSFAIGLAIPDARCNASTLRPAGLEESSQDIRDDFLKRLTAGLEETANLSNGWKALERNDFDGAVEAWGKAVRNGKENELFRDLDRRIQGASSLSPVEKKQLQEALEAMGYVLSDPLVRRALTPAQIQRLEGEFKAIAETAKDQLGKSEGVAISPAAKKQLVEQLIQLPNERQRFQLLRRAAGFSSSYALERPSGLAYAILFRFENGQRELSLQSRRAVRSFLEKKLDLYLTLSFRPLDLPLDRSLNRMESADARFAFIKDELLGWRYGEFARLTQRVRVSLKPVQGGARRWVYSYEKAPFIIRRRIRESIEHELSEWLEAPFRLDGQLRVMTRPVAEQLRDLPDTQSRLEWLLREILLLERATLLKQAGLPSNHWSLEKLTSPTWIHREEWAQIRQFLERELASRGQRLFLDKHLLPHSRPVEETVEELVALFLDERFGWGSPVRLQKRHELMVRFVRPVSRRIAEQEKERAQVLAGLLGEIHRRYRLNQALHSKNSPSVLRYYSPIRSFLNWIAKGNSSVYPLLLETLQAVAKDPTLAFPNVADPSKRFMEIKTTLKWMADLASRRENQKVPTGQLRKLAQAAGASSAGLEEDGQEQEKETEEKQTADLSRRQFMGQMLAAYVAGQGALLQRLGAAGVDPSVADSLWFFIGLVTGGLREQLEEILRDPAPSLAHWIASDIDRFRDNPENFDRWENARREDPQADPILFYLRGAEARFLASFVRPITWLDRQMGSLGRENRGAISTDRAEISVDSLMNFVAGDSSREEMLLFWAQLSRVASLSYSQEMEKRRETGASEETLAPMRERLRIDAVHRQNLERFQILPPGQQQAMLLELLEGERNGLDGLLNRVHPLVKGHLNGLLQRLEAKAIQERFAQSEAQIRERVEVEVLQPRVSSGSIFVGLTGSESAAGWVNDWEFLDAQVRKNPFLSGVSLIREEIPPGMDRLERALQLAHDLALRDPHQSVGIAVGVLSRVETERLQDFWPGDFQQGTFGPLDTLDPRLNVTFIFTPAEELEAARQEGWPLVSSFSAQFAAWAQREMPNVGLLEVLPDLTLPQHLIQRFEEYLRSRAGLEEAA